jgi:hypothetical protein
LPTARAAADDQARVLENGDPRIPVVPDRGYQYPRALCARGGIWTDWPLDRYRRETGEAISREAFSQRIVADEAFAAHWGDLGPVYGKQWVDWPVYEPAGEEGLFRRRPQGINQVAQLIAGLRSNPGGRRHIVEGWNVAELDAMALPPATRPINSMSRAIASPACSISAVATWCWGCRSTCGVLRCLCTWWRSNATLNRASWCGWAGTPISISTMPI